MEPFKKTDRVQWSICLYFVVKDFFQFHVRVPPWLVLWNNDKIRFPMKTSGIWRRFSQNWWTYRVGRIFCVYLVLKGIEPLTSAFFWEGCGIFFLNVTPCSTCMTDHDGAGSAFHWPTAAVVWKHYMLSAQTVSNEAPSGILHTSMRLVICMAQKTFSPGHPAVENSVPQCPLTGMLNDPWCDPWYK